MSIANLVTTLISQLNVTEAQAKGGAGLLFGLVKEKLGGDFSAVAAALPGVNELVSAAPQAGGVSKLAGGLLGAIGGNKAQGLAGLANLAGGFSQLKLDSGVASKFIPLVVDFAKNQAGPEIANMIAGSLQGGGTSAS